MEPHDTICNLRSEASKLLQEASDLEGNLRIQENKKLVGRCYKYKNCYSCPEKEEDYWNLYTKITGLTNSGSLKGVKFEVTSEGVASIRTFIHMHLSDKYIECHVDEFNSEADKLILMAKEKLHGGF